MLYLLLFGNGQMFLSPACGTARPTSTIDGAVDFFDYDEFVVAFESPCTP